MISMEVHAASLITTPKFDFDSILALLSKSKSDTHKGDYENSHPHSHSNWKWNWEAVEFKTSAVKCPKSLNTLVGRSFSAFNPSGICPSPCINPSSHGCSCNIDNNNSGDVAPASLPLEAEQNILEDGELEEGQICGEMQMIIEEDKEEHLITDSKEASQAEGYGYGYDYGIMPRNSAFFSNEAPIQKISQAKKKNKAKNQRRKQQRQKKANQAAPCQKKKNEREGHFIAKFKALECADKQTPQPPPKQDGPTEEKRTVIKNGESTLSSFLEGEVGLWTTQTVDEVLHDTKAEEGGDKKAKRGPLTSARKLKKKIVKMKKKALKDKQLGIKRLKLAPVTKPKPVVLCKFYMKGRCAQI